MLALQHQVFMPPMGIRAPILDLEKSQWEVTSVSGFLVFMSLVGMQTLILDLKKSQWEVTTTSGFHITCGRANSLTGPEKEIVRKVKP